MKRVGIIAKPHAQGLAELLHRLLPWFDHRHVEVFLDHDTAAAIGATVSYPRKVIPDLVDFIAVLGGDGTLLSVARVLEDRQVPILGVNLGSLGFLTEVTTAELFTQLACVLEGDYTLQDRIRFNTCLYRQSGECLSQPVVLNDVVINKGALARIINLEVVVDGLYLTTYRADGLIVATPTGSTAYSMAAGGPIVHPNLHALILSPICPYTLSHRPLVLPDTATVRVTLLTRNEDVLITLDGQIGIPLHDQDVVEIHKSPQPMRLIRTTRRDHYFHILRTKLKWGDAVKIPRDTGC